MLNVFSSWGLSWAPRGVDILYILSRRSSSFVQRSKNRTRAESKIPLEALPMYSDPG